MMTSDIALGDLMIPMTLSVWCPWCGCGDDMNTDNPCLAQEYAINLGWSVRGDSAICGTCLDSRAWEDCGRW